MLRRRIIVPVLAGGKLPLRARRMSGGSLTVPSRFHFRTDLTVQARDINYGNHLGHDAAVSLLHEARRRWLAAAGYDEAGGSGAGLIMLELEVRYTAQAFWADRLCVDMAVAGLGAARCAFRYRVSRAGQEVLRARTLMGFFDYAARRPVRRPADFLARLTALNEESDDV